MNHPSDSAPMEGIAAVIAGVAAAWKLAKKWPKIAAAVALLVPGSGTLWATKTDPRMALSWALEPTMERAIAPIREDVRMVKRVQAKSLGASADSIFLEVLREDRASEDSARAADWRAK